MCALSILSFTISFLLFHVGCMLHLSFIWKGHLDNISPIWHCFSHSSALIHYSRLFAFLSKHFSLRFPDFFFWFFFAFAFFIFVHPFSPNPHPQNSRLQHSVMDVDASLCVHSSTLTRALGSVSASICPEWAWHKTATAAQFVTVDVHRKCCTLAHIVECTLKNPIVAPTPCYVFLFTIASWFD